jgi:beta-galactosidase/beta-glucuronidase
MPELPRSEYPRPRLKRERWECLNGEWEFSFDEVASPDESLNKRIVVPFAHQWAMSGLEDRRICETVWYARSFEVPESWAGQNVLLHFGAVDYEATVWINGTEVAFHRGGHVPFTVDITRLLKASGNRVSLRVVDRQDPAQPRGKQASNGLPHGIDYWCTTGIWQTVWLEPVAPTSLADLIVTSDLGQGVLFVTPIVHGNRAELEIQVDAYEGDLHVASASGQTFEVEPLRLEIPNPRLWSPEEPFLYDLRVRLVRHGEVIDEVESYAGLRSIELRNGRFVINGEPTILRLVLDQGYWPKSGLTAPSDEALRADVEWCKRLGFNGARKHQKVEDPRWLYWCDRLGLLVWGEMANARAWSYEAQERIEAEWTCAVERDRSHPCIIAWVPLNESMGYPKLEEGDARQIAGLERLVQLTRRLNPTRPVIDNDGWEQTAASDVVAIHDYSHSGEKLASRYVDGVLPERIWSGSRISLLPGADAKGKPILLTEVGGFLMRPDVPEEELDRMYDIYDSITSTDVLLEKYLELMEGIASVPFLGGFCYTQLTDVEQELNGLLTYDRQPKVDPEAIAKAHERLTERLSQEKV